MIKTVVLSGYAQKKIKYYCKQFSDVGKNRTKIHTQIESKSVSNLASTGYHTNQRSTGKM